MKYSKTIKGKIAARITGSRRFCYVRTSTIWVDTTRLEEPYCKTLIVEVALELGIDPAFGMIHQDDHRCNKITGLPLEQKFQILMEILTTDKEYATEYTVSSKACHMLPAECRLMPRQ